VGFAFFGSQYRIQVGEEEFWIDLLFYHVKLRAYVVVDLKTQPFRAEFAGKMNFYLSAVNDLLRHPDDQPSIGLICARQGAAWWQSIRGQPTRLTSFAVLGEGSQGRREKTTERSPGSWLTGAETRDLNSHDGKKVIGRDIPQAAVLLPAGVLLEV